MPAILGYDSILNTSKFVSWYETEFYAMIGMDSTYRACLK